VTLQQVRELEIGYRGLEGGGGKAKVLEESLMLTADENIIDIQFAVQYDLKDAEDYLFNNRSPDGSVKAAAESAIREMVGKSNLDAVLQKDRENVAKATKKLMQDILDRYKSGINILSVSIQNVYPPDQVKDAFDDVNRANQDMQREVNKGQAYANEVIPKARGQAARLLEEANGYKQRVISEAQGNASRFSQILTQYEKAPEVTRSRLYLEAQEHVLSNTSKVLIDQKAGNGNILYLPLDKLISSQPSTNQPSVLPETQASPSPQSSVADESLIRSRDAFRNRERENRP
jgi:membrane protease subunit HflK